MNLSRKQVLCDLVAASLLTLLLLVLFLKGPGLGDDFTYWKYGFQIHEQGGNGWESTGFHHLRWPVWGLNWIFQGLLGIGVAAFYAEPLFYTLLGVVLAYAFGLKLFQSRAAAWTGVIIYLLHPLLNTVFYRPMPDLSEGTLIALCVYLWLTLIEEERRRNQLFLALGIGLVAGLLFSNRITGVFVFGVLGAVAFITSWKNSCFGFGKAIAYFSLIGAVWLLFVSIEGLIYKNLTGDFFHAITANTSAKGRKGTESVDLLLMPFRFFNGLWKTGRSGPYLFILGVFGAWSLWRNGGLRGRAIVAWAVSLYLAYNCSLQGINPPRPLLRDADRFLASLALPISLLAVGGLRFLFAFVQNTQPARWVSRYPIPTALAGIALLGGLSQRSLFDRGYIPEMQEYLASLEPGTKIFTHRDMRAFTFLADSEKAGGLQWTAPNTIYNYKESNEEAAAEADELWYCRKLTWISARKALERNETETQGKIASFLENPTDQWKLARVINVGDVPELCLYKKRLPSEPKPVGIEMQNLFPEIPAFPIHWKAEKKETLRERFTVKVPEKLRGKAIGIEVSASANSVQAAILQITFRAGEKEYSSIQFRPYFYPTTARDFHALQIPADATECEILIKEGKKAKWINLDYVRIIAE